MNRLDSTFWTKIESAACDICRPFWVQQSYQAQHCDINKKIQIGIQLQKMRNTFFRAYFTKRQPCYFCDIVNGEGKQRQAAEALGERHHGCSQGRMIGKRYRFSETLKMEGRMMESASWTCNMQSSLIYHYHYSTIICMKTFCLFVYLVHGHKLPFEYFHWSQNRVNFAT